MSSPTVATGWAICLCTAINLGAAEIPFALEERARAEKGLGACKKIKNHRHVRNCARFGPATTTIVAIGAGNVLPDIVDTMYLDSRHPQGAHCLAKSLHFVFLSQSNSRRRALGRV